jgi:protein TonB
VEELLPIPLTLEDLVPTKNMEPAPATLGCEVEDTSTNLVKKVTPEYPRFSRMNGHQGPAIFYAFIQKDGTIRELTTVFSPDAEIEKSARDAIQKWRYKPFVVCGQATEVETTITIHFSLSG